jgi:tetratricopeptide (TPR) repeat protein
MSPIEQALRKIDLQREKESSARNIRSTLPQPSPIGMMLVSQPTPAGYRWRWVAISLTVLIAALVAGAGSMVSGYWGRGATTTGQGAQGATLPTTTAAPTPMAQAVTPATLPVFEPDASQGASGSAGGDQTPQAAWQVQASMAWDSGAWDHASRLWVEGLRRNAPSTLALQIAELQTLEQAQRLHQIWSPYWPLAMLAQASPTGPGWLVLALPQAADVDAAQQQLSRTLGRPVPWANVVQWLAKADMGQAQTASAADTPWTRAPETAVTATAPAPPASGARKPDKPLPAVASSTPAPAAAPSQMVTTAASVPPQKPKEQPLVSRSGGAAPDDQVRAVQATQAIDVDFSMVEQLLAKADYTKAVLAAERLEGYIGSNWRTRYLTGVALSGLGRWKDAVEALSSARQKNPGHARVALYLAVALQETGDHGSAIETLLKAVVIHPVMPELWLNQGHSLQAQGRTGEAAQAYRRFLELSTTRMDLSAQRSWVTHRLQKAS